MLQRENKCLAFPLFASFQNEWVLNILQRHLEAPPWSHRLSRSPCVFVKWPTEAPACGPGALRHRPALEQESCCELVGYTSCPRSGTGPSSKKSRFPGRSWCWEMLPRDFNILLQYGFSFGRISHASLFFSKNFLFSQMYFSHWTLESACQVPSEGGGEH